MRKIYFALLLVLAITSKSFAQSDCSSAVIVCGNTKSFDPSGVGTKLEQLACGGIEHNSIWIAFQAKASGTLNFVIRPTTPAGIPTLSDFDWSLYQLNGAPGVGNCDAKTQLSCNFAGTATVFGIPGATGMGTPPFAATQFNPGINVVSGNWYVLIVDQFSNTIPLLFSVQFTGNPESPALNSTPGIFDDRPEFSINNTSGCGGTFSFVNTSVSIPGIASYSWDFGDGSTGTGLNPTHTYSTTGTYYVTVEATDNNGCKSYNRRMLAYNNTAPVVNAGGILVLPSCSDANNGVITVNSVGTATAGVAGGTPPYMYELVSPSPSIRPAQSSNTFTGLQPGGYTVKVTDACGKSGTATVTVTQVAGNTTIGLGIQNIQSACTGTPTGSATIFANGTVPPYTMALVNSSPVLIPPQTAVIRDAITSTYYVTFENLLPGSYTVEATDACGKIRRATFTVTASTLPVANTVASPSCAGTPTGTLTVTATAATGLSGAGSPGTHQYALIAPSAITRPFQNSSVFENLLPGAYTIAVKDACGNIGTATANVTSAIAPTFGTAFTTPSCPNGATGTIEAQIATAGGGTPYTFELVAPSPVTRPAQTSNAFTALPPGVYTVRLTDACGSIVNSNVTVSAASAPTFSNTVTASCLTPASGTATIAPGASAIGPYTFELISPGAAIRPPQGSNVANTFNSIFTGLSQGSYTVRMIDGCNVPVTGIVTIVGPTALAFPTGSVTVPSCAVSSTGQITVAQPTTGLGAYKYELIAPSAVIKPQQYSRIFNDLPDGSYTVRITDSCGTQVIIGAPLAVGVAAPPTLSVTSTSSCATASGSITATATTGNQGGGIYLFSIIAPSPVTRPNQASPIFTGLPDGNYTVQITDQCGVTGTTTAVIAVAGSFAPTAGGSVVSCAGGGAYNGQIIVTTPQNFTPGGPIPPGSGGGPYTYALYNFDNTVLITGPQSSNIFSVVVPSTGTPTHTVRVTDACGNTSTAIATINNPVALTAATISAITASCAASSTGVIRITTVSNNGLAPYTYTLIDAVTNAIVGGPQSSIVFNGVPANGTNGYLIRSTDACGNIATSSVPLLFPAAAAPSGSVVTVASCASPGTGRITVTSNTGATQAGGTFTYALYDITNVTLIAGPQSTAVFNNVAAGDYTVRITDRCGTTGTIAANVSNTVTALTAAGTATGTCTGGTTGVITGSFTGGSLPVTYTLVDQPSNTVITGPQSNNIFSGLAAGTYIVRTTDACGTIANSANIVVADLVSNPTITTTTALDCAGSAVVSGYGAAGNGGPFTYALCTGAGCTTFGAFTTTSTFTVLSSGTYRIAVRDRCDNQTISADIVVVIPTKPVITAVTKTTLCGPTTITVTFSGVPNTPYYSLDGANFGPTIGTVGLGAHTIRVSDFNAGTYGCASDAFSFFVGANPSITNPVNTNGTTGVAFSETFTQTGGAPTVNFTTASTLPTGLTLSSSGLLSGIPTQTGLFPIVVTATDGNGCIGTSATYNLNIALGCPVITITNPVNTNGTASVAFSETFTASGGASPYIFTTASTLPTGITLSTGGVLNGTPTQAGTFPIVVTATDNNTCAANSATYNLVIGACTPATTNGCANGDYLDYFSLKGSAGTVIYNPSGNTCNVSPLAYSNYTGAFPAVTLVRSETFGGFIRTGNANDYASIWIDQNDNGLFESTERVLSNLQGGTIKKLYAIYIPSTFTLGTHLMRIRIVHYASAPVSGTDPCSLYADGETEDYLVNITNVGTTRAVAAGTIGSCEIGSTITIGTESNNANALRVMFVDSTNNYIGGITPNGNELGTVTSSFYKHNGAVRQDFAGKYYLDRNITITASTAPAATYSLRYFFQTSELNSLIAQPGSGVTSVFDLNSTKTSINTCSGSFATNNSVLIPPVGFGSIGGDRFLDFTGISSLSSFFLHGGASVLVSCSTITVTNPVNASGTAGTSFSETFTASGGTSPYSFSTASTLPTGLTLSLAGVLSGTPTQSGTFPIVVTVTDNNGCSGTGGTYTLVISCPVIVTPTVTPGGPTTFCTGGSVTLTSSSASGNQWYESGNPIGGATNQTYVATTSGSYTVVVTQLGCSSSPSAATTVTVNPTPDAVATPLAQQICSGSTITTIVLTGAVGGTVYNWTRDNAVPVTGIAASGSGDISGALTNTTNAPVTVTFTITPTANSCPGTPVTATVVVNPIPDATATPSSQSRCSGQAITPIIMSGAVSGTVFNWTRDNFPTIGGSIGASGSGNISGTLVNNTGSPVTVTFTITPTANSCPGTPITATVTVNPNPAAFTIGGAGTFCPGTAVTLTGPVDPNYTYQWGRTLFTAPFTNLGTAQTQPVTASGFYHLTVTNQFGCSATSNPDAVVNIADYVFNGSLGAGDAVQTGRINRFAVVSTCAAPKACPGIFTATGARFYDAYTITNVRNTPVCVTIGHNSGCATNAFSVAYLNSFNPASLCTNYLADPGSSPSTSIFYEATIPANGTIVVIVHEVNTGTGCANYQLTVNVPRDPSAITVAPGASSCSGLPITLTAPVANSYSWSPGVATTQSIVHTTGTTNYTVTLGYGNNGCTATASQSVTIADPVVNPVPNQGFCNRASASVVFSGGDPGTVYNWTNTNPAIGLGASGSGNLNFTATNATAAPISGTITVTPVNGVCTGTPITFTITVANQPGIISVTDATICGAGVANLSATGNGVINWWNSSTGGIVVNTGNTFSPNVTTTTTYYLDAAINSGTQSLLAMPGQSTTFPGNVRGYWFTAPTDFVITSLSVPTTASSGPMSVAVVKFTGNTPPPVFSATTNAFTTMFQAFNNPTLGSVPCNISVAAGEVIGILGYRGNINSYAPGDYNTTIAGFPVQLQRLGTQFPLNALPPHDIWREFGPTTSISRVEFEYSSSQNCISAPRVPVTATVKAVPVVTATPAAQTICNGSAITTIVLGTDQSGTTYAWTRDNTGTVTGIAASGTTNISGILTNTTSAPVTVTFTITSDFNGCPGVTITATVTVNPTVTVNAVSNQTICNGASTTAINFTSPATGGTIVYNWTNNTPSIGVAASGSGNIASFVGTNATNAPVTATITVTPTYTNGVSCVGTPITFTITVNPTATVNAVTNQTVCNGANTTAVNFTSPTTGGTIVYNWTNNTTSIGLAASGSGNIASFVGTNATGAPVTATITVTPTYTNGVSCVGTPITFTITVNPTATVNAVSNQTVCNGASTAAVNFTSPTTGGTIFYNWTNNTTSIGLAASGSGNIASFVGTNATSAPVTATITVTPTYTNGVSCVGTPITFTITVNPTATVNTVANQVICNGTNTTAVNFTSPTTGGTIVYNWTNNTTSIGLGASGSGNIASFVGTNATNAPVTATITVTPTYTNVVSCVGTPITFTITVNPTATINAVANQVVCNNASTAAVNFTSPTTGGTIVYNWTNNTPSIGLAAGGTGNIASFTAINTGTAPVTATVVVTPSYTNGGVTCTGTPTTFTITVNPTATVNAVANQTVCNGTATAAVNFTSPTTGGTIVYNWTNNTTSIGLGASGVGNIASFTGTNASNAPVTATIVVTPNYTNGGVTCVGTPLTFTITVNPTPVVNQPANQIVCNNTLTTVNFTSPTTGGTLVYNWTNTNPAIGLGAGGSGNISFTSTNTTPDPIMGTITVTPVYTNNGVTCTGTPKTFTITVNPTVVLNPVPNQVVCNGAGTAAVNFTTATSIGTVVYNWTNTNPAIGLAASGTGDIASFIATNGTNAPITGSITVIPVYINGVSCPGTPLTFTITVNPTATVNAVSSQTVCNNTATAAVNFTSPTTGGTIVYNWTNSAPSIGLAASGAGNIASFTAINTTTAPVVATIVVTPAYTNGGVTCNGTPLTFTITVNPTATVNTVANQTVCNNTATAAVNFTSPTTGGTIVYNWTNNTTSIGLAASGTGNIASFIATNATSAPVVATIVVTPSYTNNGVTCAGTPFTFTITVNPTATVNTVANQTVCNNTATAAVNFTSPATGGTIVYNWTNSNTSIGLAASGAGNIASFTGTNITNVPQTGTIIVTPAYTNGGVTCNGTPFTFTITVNPTATVNAVANQTVCNGTATAAVNFTSPATGGTIVYNWTNSAPSIGLAASGAGNIASFTATNATNAPVVAVVVVTPAYTNNGVTCNGTPMTFTIAVNPTATVNAVPNQTVCNEAFTAAINFTSPTTGGTIVYNWTNNTPSIGLASSGTGNIPSFMALNAGTAPVTATIVVTPAYTNGVTCPGTPRSFFITVNPTPNATAAPAAQTVCSGNAITPIAITTTVPGTVFSWTRSNTASVTGIAASGTGNNISGTLTNTTNVQQTVVFTITPSYSNGGTTCTGNPVTATVIVPAGVTIVCPANIVVSAAAGTCAATVTFAATSPSVPAPTITYSQAPGSSFPVGVTTVVVTATSPCGTVTCSFTVTVTDAQVPTITTQPTNQTVCENSTATFTVAGTLIGSYQWQIYNGLGWVNIQGANGPSLVLNNVSLSMNLNLYRVQVTGPCATTITSQFVTLRVNALPVVTLTTSIPPFLIPGETLTIIATGFQPGGSFVWRKDGVVIPGATSSTLPGITVNGLGVYTATYTDANGCTSLPRSITIGGRYSYNLYVYPNPNNGQFNIRFYNEANERVTVRVFNYAGALVFQQVYTTGLQAYAVISVNMGNRLPDGTYMVTLLDDDNQPAGYQMIVVKR